MVSFAREPGVLTWHEACCTARGQKRAVRVPALAGSLPDKPPKGGSSKAHFCPRNFTVPLGERDLPEMQGEFSMLIKVFCPRLRVLCGGPRVCTAKPDPGRRAAGPGGEGWRAAEPAPAKEGQAALPRR